MKAYTSVSLAPLFPCVWWYAYSMGMYATLTQRIIRHAAEQY